MRTITAVAAAALLAACTATPPGALPGALPNPAASPTYGEATVGPGFTQSIQVAAGGSIAVSSVARCRGTINGPPDFNVVFPVPGSGPLVIGAQSSADSVLVVQTPSGRWLCDDNTGGGLNPTLVLAAPEAGTYHVWVGNASAGAPGLYPLATLRFN